MVKHSELEEWKWKYKGRVVFGGHRIHDEYGLAAEFPEQGSGASFLTSSKLCDTVFSCRDAAANDATRRQKTPRVSWAQA